MAGYAYFFAFITDKNSAEYIAILTPDAYQAGSLPAT
jgi:hypothetical protein